MTVTIFDTVRVSNTPEVTLSFDTRAGAEAGNTGTSKYIIAAGLIYENVTSGGVLTTGDGRFWKPAGNVVYAEQFGAVADDATDNTAAFQAAHDYMAGLGGGRIILGDGAYRFGVVHFWGDNVTFAGEGGGYRNGEFTQSDKAKILANAATVLRYNGASNGIWITRRPKSYFGRHKVVGGGFRDMMIDGLTGPNKAGIAVREQNVENGLFERCTILGALSRSVDVTGMLTGFSGGDDNSAYTKFNNCLFIDKVVDSTGANVSGGGRLLSLGAEFNATNIYLDGCHLVSSSSSVPELDVENTDHCEFHNVRCNTGGAVFHADDTGTFNVRHCVKFKDETGGGFAVGDTVTGATSGATGGVVEVRVAESSTFGAIFLTGVTGTFTAGENLQVSATTRGVAENRTHLLAYDITGTITVGATLTGATSGATMVVDEVFLDPANTAGGVIFAEAADVTGTFSPREDLKIGSTVVAAATDAQVVIGTGTWTAHRAPSSVSRYNQFYRWFGKMTFKASVAGTYHTMGNEIFGYPVVDPFGVVFPTVEKGARVRVHADSVPGEYGTWTGTPISFGGQAAHSFSTIAATAAHGTSGSWLNVSWDTVVDDPLSAVSGTSWTDITVPDGIYQIEISASVQFNANATGQRGIKSVFLTSSGAPATQPTGNLEMIVNAASSGETTIQASSAKLNVEPGWKFRIQTFQDSGGSVNMATVNTWVDVQFF